MPTFFQFSKTSKDKHPYPSPRGINIVLSTQKKQNVRASEDALRSLPFCILITTKSAYSKKEIAQG